MNAKYFIKSALTNYRMYRSGRMNSSLASRFPSLTSEEWSEVKQFWQLRMEKRILKVYPKGHRIFKGLEGFDARYCPNSFFETYIIRALNLPVHVMALEHKAMYDMVFPNIPKPKTVLKRINGVYYDGNLDVLSFEDCYRIVKEYRHVCIKPSTFSAGGNAVQKVECDELSSSQFRAIADSYGDNFIVQEILSQSEKMQRLSKSSLNTFRVSSLYINGECTICTIICRIGKGDSFVDNGAKGNYIVGVTENGQFREYAYDFDYKKYTESDTGVRFCDVQLEEVQELCRIVKENHRKCLPNCGFCGWDFALDGNNTWNLIEVNLYAPGIEFEQICPGEVLFGDRTKEVIEYVNNHQPSLLGIMTSLGYK